MRIRISIVDHGDPRKTPGAARSCQELPRAARSCQELPGAAREPKMTKFLDRGSKKRPQEVIQETVPAGSRVKGSGFRVFPF